MKRADFLNRVLLLVCNGIIFIPLSFWKSLFLYIFLVIIFCHIFLFIFNIRPFFLYVGKRLSHTAFRLNKLKEDEEREWDSFAEDKTHNQVDIDEVLEYLWNGLCQEMDFSPLNHTFFEKKFHSLIKRYDKKVWVDEKDISFIIEEIIKFMGLNPKVVKVKVKFGRQYAGRFRMRYNIAGEIEINVIDNMNIYNLFSTCFHECIHYYFAMKDIDFGEDEEYFTDAALVYFGVDNIAVKGYSVFVSKKNLISGEEMEEQIGYLNIEDIKYLIRIKNE